MQGYILVLPSDFELLVLGFSSVSWVSSLLFMVLNYIPTFLQLASRLGHFVHCNQIFTVNIICTLLCISYWVCFSRELWIQSFNQLHVWSQQEPCLSNPPFLFRDHVRLGLHTLKLHSTISEHLPIYFQTLDFRFWESKFICLKLFCLSPYYKKILILFPLNVWNINFMQNWRCKGNKVVIINVTHFL